MKIAVIRTGGKQYVVSEGSVITIEKLPQTDGEVSFDSILTDDGNEVSLAKGKVSGTVLKAGKGKKVVVVKYKAKSRYFKKRGHRQPFTKVKIKNIF